MLRCLTTQCNNSYLSLLFTLNCQQSRMRETRLKAQADSKNAALKLLEGRVAENEKTRKDHEDRMKFKIETMEQVYYYPSNSL